MGLFSGIIDSIKDSMSYIADTTVDLLGNVTDILKPTQHYPDRPQKETRPECFDYDMMYDDYSDWINEIWY